MLVLTQALAVGPKRWVAADARRSCSEQDSCEVRGGRASQGRCCKARGRQQATVPSPARALDVAVDRCMIAKGAQEARVRERLREGRWQHTWDSVGGFSSSLSGAAPREAPGRLSPVPMPRRFAKFSSRFAFRISTCCSSRRRRSSSGLKVFFALNWVLLCSGM